VRTREARGVNGTGTCTTEHSHRYDLLIWKVRVRWLQPKSISRSFTALRDLGLETPLYLADLKGMRIICLRSRSRACDHSVRLRFWLRRTLLAWRWPLGSLCGLQSSIASIRLTCRNILLRRMVEATLCAGPAPCGILCQSRIGARVTQRIKVCREMLEPDAWMVGRG